MVAEPLRVLMTADTVGGVWTHALELTRALSARGVQVDLATMGALPSAAQRDAARAAGATLHASRHRLEWMDEPWDDVRAAGAWLLDLAATLRPGVVHLNQFAFGALPFAAPTLVVAHSCVLSWWHAVHGVPAPTSWDRYRQVVRDGLAGASLVGAPTRAMLAALAEHHGRDDGVVLPNARSPGEFRAAAKEPFILAAGRLWDAAKNLAAAEAVAPRLPWPVRVAGPSAAPDGVAPAPSSAVHALGELSSSALSGELARASIFVAPARYEPFGQAALEAALAGCALVLGDIASLREVWGTAALYVAPDDHDGLHAALAMLIDDAPLRRDMAARARARALEFSPGRMVDAYLSAYARIAPRFERRARARETPSELACAS